MAYSASAAVPHLRQETGYVKSSGYSGLALLGTVI